MKIAKLLSFISLFAFISSCTFYKPTVMNAPILEEKGELNVGVSAGNSFDFNASYTITDHFAVIANAGNSYNITYTLDTGFTGTTEKFKFKNYKYEMAGAYYNHWDDQFYLNSSLGYARGASGSLTDDIDGFGILNGAFGGNYNLFFLQSSMHVKFDDIAYFGLVGRINSINYNDFDHVFDAAGASGLASGESYLVSQVALDFNVKGEKIGGFAQMQFAFHNGSDQYFSVRRLGLHAGVYLRLGEIFK